MRLELVNQMQGLRYWGAGWDNPILDRLAFINKRFPDFLFATDGQGKEHAWLVQNLADERHHHIVNKILRPQVPSVSVSRMEAEICELKRLVYLCDANTSPLDCQMAIQGLSISLQELLHWAVWVHFGAPNEADFGKRMLNERPSLLNEIQSPIVHVKGRRLCEQVLHHYERHCALERQRNIVQLFQGMAEKLQTPFPRTGEALAMIEELPRAIQEEIHGAIFTHSPIRRWEDGWGGRHLSENPQVLVQIKDPYKPGQHLLDQYLQLHQSILRQLELLQGLEEFECLTLAFKTMSPSQRQEMLRRASPRVRDEFISIERIAHQRSRLRSDQRHLYQWRGAHLKIHGTDFQVFAPHARQVQLVLTAFGREEHVIPMQRTGLGVWEALHISHAPSGRTYRYRIEDCHGNWTTRTDPFGFMVTEVDGTLQSVVTETDAYHWNDDGWMQERSHSNPLTKPLSIYELHVDSWKKRDGRPLSFGKLAHQIIEHFERIPFTHVQLYGLLDNKNDYSWGYQVDHFFALNRRLGHPDDFKYLVDICHQKGIGVLVDWVPAHYKHEHNGDRSQSLHEFDGTNHFSAEISSWGTAYFDFGKEEARRLLLASALHLFEKFHIDGLRHDAVGPMLYRNGEVKYHAIDFLKELNNVVHGQYPGILMIAEETDNFPNVTQPVSEGGLGFDIKLGVHLQYRARKYFQTPYAERSRGEHHYGKLMFNLNEMRQRDRWMLAHSHDDAATGSFHRHSTLYGSIPTENTWRKFADMRTFHAWNLLSPGSGHLIHMGDEIGQKWPWNERLTASEGAVEWHLLDSRNPESYFHWGLMNCVGDLNRLYRSKPALWKHGQWGYKPISDHRENRVVGFHRLDFEGGRLAVFCNFSPMGYCSYDFPLPSLDQDPELGWVRGAREIFNSDANHYGGSGQFSNGKAEIIRNAWGAPTHFRFAMPPLSIVVFEETWE